MFIPSTHCISSIWLLENLRELNEGILHAEVNFSKKEVTINFNPQVIKLEIVGESPDVTGIRMADHAEGKGKHSVRPDNQLAIKI